MKCEPCKYLGVDTAAVTVTGWDFTPTCRWHEKNSWSSKPQERKPMPVTTVRLPDETLERIDRLTAAEGTRYYRLTRSDFIRDAVETALTLMDDLVQMRERTDKPTVYVKKGGPSPRVEWGD